MLKPANKTLLNSLTRGLQSRDLFNRLAPPVTVLRRLRGPGEAAALALTIAAGVRTAMLLATPLPIPAPAEAASSYAEDAVYDSASRAGGHPFSGAKAAGLYSAAPIEESALNIVLYGTWRGSAGVAAMLSADGSPQKKVAVGEEIITGVVLEEVQDEYVVISNQGSREAVAIANRDVEIGPLNGVASDASAPILAQPSTASLRDRSIDGEGAAKRSAVAADLAALQAERLGDADATAAAHEPE